MSAGGRTRSARLPLIITAIGVALLIFMVTTEGEPGALPLGLIVLGVIGHLVARRRARPPRAGSAGSVRIPRKSGHAEDAEDKE